MSSRAISSKIWHASCDDKCTHRLQNLVYQGFVTAEYTTALARWPSGHGKSLSEALARRASTYVDAFPVHEGGRSAVRLR
jgi:hypothetical protein